jgi:two-component system sensor histidine kinase SenX3
MSQPASPSGEPSRAHQGTASVQGSASKDWVQVAPAVLDALPLGLLLFSRDGREQCRNATAERMLTSSLSGTLTRAAVEELAQSARRRGAQSRLVELYGPPRQSVVVECRRLDPADPDSDLLVILEDVTERRRLESVRRDFVANVSHELKTPVAALGLLAETLANESAPEVAARLASRIQAEAFRVNRIISDLLDLSRLEAEESPVRQEVALGSVVEEAASQLRSQAQAAGVSIVLRLDPSGPVVLGDRRQLVVAVRNLVENAVKYSDPPATVEVEVGTEGDEATVVVRDSGIGIPSRDLERIFERFYRVDAARSRSTGGTGLGLAIVRHVAHNHDGQIEVTSREGEGSTFTLRLPVREEES